MSSRVVAIGGGHGLANLLRALRVAGEEPTAIVSVADDGGSTGRLRRDLGVLAVGDLRKCLVALADEHAPGPWPAAFEHRFAGGDLDGHALGNLVLVGLEAATGSWVAALAEAGAAVGARGTVLPATTEAVALTARTDRGTVTGQVAVQHAPGRIESVALEPPAVSSPPEAVAAIGAADLVVLAPGSLYTSLLPALLPPEITAAVVHTGAPVVAVLNLAPQAAETIGMDAADHLRAITATGVRVTAALADPQSRVPVDPAAVAALGIRLIVEDVARPDVSAHAPAKLAPALAALLQS